MAVWQWRLRTTQWRDTTFSCPIKRLCYRKLTLKNCTLPTVCSWGCRLQSHFSSRLLSESEWRQQRGRADFFLSASISDRPKRPKQPLIIKPLAKKVTKTRCATTFFSLFVADIVLFLKHFFKFQLFFSKNSLKILLFVLIYEQLSGTESTFTRKSRNLDPHLWYPTG